MAADTKEHQSLDRWHVDGLSRNCGSAEETTDRDVVMIRVTDELLDQMVQAIVDEVDPEQVILSGSYARGDQSEDSDVDLVVVETEPFGKSRSRRMEAVRLWKALSAFLVPKDILVPDYARSSARSDELAEVVVFLGSRASLPADGARSAAFASLAAGWKPALAGGRPATLGCRGAGLRIVRNQVLGLQPRSGGLLARFPDTRAGEGSSGGENALPDCVQSSGWGLRVLESTTSWERGLPARERFVPARPLRHGTAGGACRTPPLRAKLRGRNLPTSGHARIGAAATKWCSRPDAARPAFPGHWRSNGAEQWTAFPGAP